MPVGNAQFIKELDPNNPVGSVDQVSILDDSDREIKRAIVNTFPNMDGQVIYSTRELNDLRQNLGYNTGQFSIKNNTLVGVKAIEDNTAVQPRSYNDGRYLNISKNLSDLTNTNDALKALSANLDGNSIGYRQFKAMVNNMVYGVGSLYFQTGSNENPNSILGVGTWVKYGSGRCLVGTGDLNDGSGNRNFALGATGGNFGHQLSAAELPSHNHAMFQASWNNYGTAAKDNPAGRVAAGGIQRVWTDRDDYQLMTSVGGADCGVTAASGSNAAHNNMQPYISVNIWQRVG